MSQLAMTKEYDSINPLLKSQLDDLYGSLEAFVNGAEIGGDNIQDAAITSTVLTSNSVDSTKIAADSIGDTKFADSSVTKAIQEASNNGAVNSFLQMGASNNIECDLTVVGRPVLLFGFNSQSSSAGGWVNGSNPEPNIVERDGNDIGELLVEELAPDPMCFLYLDVPLPGARVYLFNADSHGNLNSGGQAMVAMELL